MLEDGGFCSRVSFNINVQVCCLIYLMLTLSCLIVIFKQSSFVDDNADNRQAAAPPNQINFSYCQFGHAFAELQGAPVTGLCRSAPSPRSVGKVVWKSRHHAF